MWSVGVLRQVEVAPRVPGGGDARETPHARPFNGRGHVVGRDRSPSDIAFCPNALLARLEPNSLLTWQQPGYRLSLRSKGHAAIAGQIRAALFPVRRR